jgi:hypothetical protein
MILMKKQFLLATLLLTGLLLSAPSFSQNVNVTSTSGALTGSYSTLKQAFDNVNSGTFSGDITLNIVANTIETDPLLLNGTGIGLASFTSLYIFTSGNNEVSGTMATTTATGSILGNTLTVTAVSAGTLKVGQLISGTNILPGTVITDLGTGTGAAGTYTVNVTYASAVASTAITGAANFITLNGAGNVVFDGRLGQTGNTTSLTFSNLSTATTASTILFMNDASNNTLRYCNVTGSSTAVTTGNIVIGTTTGTTGNDNIVINYCNVYNSTAGTPEHAIHALGSTTTTALYNDNCTISNCNIYNFFNTTAATRGLNIGVGNNGWTVSGNSFYQTAARTGLAGVFQFLSVAPSASHTSVFSVTNNYFGGTQPQCGGSPMSVTGTATGAEFRSVIFTGSQSVVNSFQGNVFQNMAVTVGYNSTTNVQCFLQTNVSSIQIGTLTPNLFGDSTGLTSVTISTGAGASFAAMALGHGGATNCTIQNNVISGIKMLQGTSLRGIQIGNNGGGQNYAINSTVANNKIGSMNGSGALATTGSTPIIGIYYNLGSSATTLQTIENNYDRHINGRNRRYYRNKCGSNFC